MSAEPTRRWRFVTEGPVVVDGAPLGATNATAVEPVEPRTPPVGGTGSRTGDLKAQGSLQAAEYTIGSLCSGYGGLDMAVQDVLGGTVAWHAETDPHASTVLDTRFPHVPNLNDFTTIDWAEVEPVDILTAGFPCQPVSNAGKRLGDQDDRWLWPDVASAMRVLRPRLTLLENVAAIAVRGLDRVLADLAEIGFDASWACVRASDIGAAHRRERWFLLAWPADPEGPRLEARREGRPGGAVQDADVEPRLERRLPAPGQAESRGARADARGRGRAPAADAGRVEPERRGGLGVLGGQAPAEPRQEGQRERAGNAPVDRGAAPADTDNAGARPQPDRASHEPEGDDEHEVLDAPGRVLDWGTYAAAITRWGHVMGRPAPAPTEPGKNGERLSPAFVEWLMGLPSGWVTDTGIPRNAQLKCLGNGVVPQQGAAALRELLTTATELETR